MRKLAAALLLLPLLPLEALALDLDPDGMANDVVTVLAPIAPGLIRPARVRAWRVLPVGETIPINCHPCTLALDGERTLHLPTDSAPITIRIHWSGPHLLDPMAVEERPVKWKGRDVMTLVYHYRGHAIWGATARILADFLEALRGEKAAAASPGSGA